MNRVCGLLRSVVCQIWWYVEQVFSYFWNDEPFWWPMLQIICLDFRHWFVLYSTNAVLLFLLCSWFSCNSRVGWFWWEEPFLSFWSVILYVTFDYCKLDSHLPWASKSGIQWKFQRRADGWLRSQCGLIELNGSTAEWDEELWWSPGQLWAHQGR